MKQRVIASILAALLCISSMPCTAFAEGAGTPSEWETEILPGSDMSGTCGEEMNYILTGNVDSGYKLTIFGSGSMNSYSSANMGSDNLAPWAAKGANITSIVINSGVTTIGEYAFESCTQATSVTIPDSVIRIRTGAFSTCRNLTAVNYSGSTADWNNIEIYNDNDYLLKTYYAGQGITPTGSCGDNVTYKILGSDSTGCQLVISGTGAMDDSWGNEFWNNYNITSVVVEEGVTSIGENAFAECKNLQTVTLPVSVTSIGSGAFDLNTNTITTVTYAGNINQWNAILIDSDNEELTGATINCQAAVPAVKITSQPTSVSAVIGEVATFKVVAENAASYQWQSSSNGSSWTSISGASAKTDTLTVNVLEANAGCQYRCKITGENGKTVYSSAATLTVLQAVEITSQPISTSAKIGEKASFSVTANNVVSYQWQMCTDGSTWKNSTASGNKTARVSVTVSKSNDGAQYRCKLTGGDGVAVYTVAVTLFALQAAEITMQPANIPAAIGDKVSFTVEANHAVSYQWQYSKDGVDWKNSGVSSAKTATLNLTASSTNIPNMYRCQITGEDGSVIYSESAKMIEKVNKPEIKEQPVDSNVSIGDKVSFHVTAENAKSYQWQYSKDGTTWKNSTITSAYTDTISMTVSTSNIVNMYRCQITGEDGSVIYSETAKMIAKTSKPVIKEQPVDSNVSIGDKVSFHVTAENAKSYQWQYSKDGTTWKNSTITSAYTDTISMTVSTSNIVNMYRCQITGEDGSVIYSETAKMIAKTSKPVIKEQPVDSKVSIGDKVSFHVTAENAKSYQWQYSKDGASWKNSTITSAYTDTITMTVSGTNIVNMYRCQITGEDGSVIYSNTAKMIEKVSGLVIKEQPVDSNVSIGDKVSFHVTAENAKSYQWQYSKDGASWKNSTITSAYTDTITMTVSATNIVNMYRCQITGEDGSVIYSETANMIEKTSGLVITQQPTNVTAGNGTKISFHVAATNAVSYQWQYSKDGVTWKNSGVTSATTDTLNLTVSDTNRVNKYRCEIKDAAGNTVYTNAVVIK